MIREAAVSVESEFINRGRLERTGDVFHLSVEEFDKALVDESLDLMALVRPRRARYEHRLAAHPGPAGIRGIRASAQQRRAGIEGSANRR